MSLSLYDARRRTLVPFEPIGPRAVGLYVCGVTPYDTGHLGHAFTYVSFDVLNRYLRHLGHTVVYVQNLTDVDDDLLRRAREVGEDYLALAERFTDSFLAEMAALNWLPPEHFPRATRHIPHMQALVARLLERGLAYAAAGHVYFSVDAWPSYGELSGLARGEMLPIANERGNLPEMTGKRDPLDFVLWQPSTPDEPAWPSPWGPGRPGWHIECSAMSMAYLGSRFEIHGGGADLAFPHHESEIAQSEGATGEGPFVSWWMHTGMLSYASEKMSKSLGNLVLVRDLLRDWSADAIRHYLVSHHYRDELAFDAADLAASAARVARLASAAEPHPGSRAASHVPDEPVERLRAAFLAAMDDDLDTPTALRRLDDLAELALDPAAPAARRAAAGGVIRELAVPVIGLRLGTAP